MQGIRVYFDYGFGKCGLGTYIYCAKTNKILIFIKEKV
jgi:hypothetical protein